MDITGNLATISQSELRYIAYKHKPYKNGIIISIIVIIIIINIVIIIILTCMAKRSLRQQTLFISLGFIFFLGCEKKNQKCPENSIGSAMGVTAALVNV